MSTDDPYATLGVARTASAEDIKRSFRALARECHPDVAGGDPNAAARFTRVREAYETLIDPELRARYDRRDARRKARAEGRNGVRMPGGFWSGSGFSARPGSAPEPPPGATGGRRRGAPVNNLDLEDIFGDFTGGGTRPQAGERRTTPGGHSYGGGRPGSSGPVSPGGAPPSDFGFGANRPGRDGGWTPQPGRDIAMQVDVPAETARRGGVVTLHYPRLRLADDGRNVFRYDEICDLRVPPGTRHGDTLRVERMGDAGTNATFGDLVCDVRLVGIADEDPWSPATEGPADPPPRNDSPDLLRLPVSVGEALLGGRVVVDTPQGAVRLTLPPCMRPGARLRLRGKAADGGDLYVEPYVVLPASLDAESRALVERFAALNPDDPREDGSL